MYRYVYIFDAATTKQMSNTIQQKIQAFFFA